MPAPPSSDLTSKAIANYEGSLSPEAKEYLAALMKAVADGWSRWHNSIGFGSLSVQGQGLGMWAGTGAGGSFSAANFKVPDFTFKKDTPPQKKLTKALGTVLGQKFTLWVQSYKVSTSNFAGPCTATTEAPGLFTANLISTPVGSAGSGTNPRSVAEDWAKLLTKPDFDIENPKAQTKILLRAVGKAIEETFETTWLTSSQLSGNTATGPATMSVGFGQGTSLPDGKIV